MPLEHQVRIYLYLSTMSAAKTQYLFDQLDMTKDDLGLWRDVIKNRQSAKKILVPNLSEPLPDWISWPKGLNEDSWRSFLVRSSRLSIDVLILSFILKKSDLEIAEILEVTEGGVLIALSEGLARLGEHLK